MGHYASDAGSATVKQEPRYVFFENTHGDCDEDGNEFIIINGHPADKNEEGAVIATVFITPSGDLVTDFHHNGYRLNKEVKKLIEESKETLVSNWEDRTSAPQDFEFRVIFDDDDDRELAETILDAFDEDYDYDDDDRMMLKQNGLNLLEQTNIDYEEV